MRTQFFTLLRFCLTGGSAVFLGCCALAVDLTWPERGSDPYPWPKPKGSGKIVDDRFAHASTNSLGTTNDIAAVKRAITKNLKPREVEVREIRWLYPTSVMAYTRTQFAAFYYVTEKKQDEWKILTYYMLWVT